MTADDALNHLVGFLKAGVPLHRQNQDHHDVYLEVLLWEYMRRHEGYQTRNTVSGSDERRMAELAAPFLTAAWELCRRGILRPGHNTFLIAFNHTTPENVYTLTDFGREWLRRTELAELTAIVPKRFVELLNGFVARFGPGYRSRAEQAVMAYHAQAYLAACAMCGAASESIMLALAIERFGEVRVLQDYSRAGGRAKVRNMLVGNMSGADQKNSTGSSARSIIGAMSQRTGRRRLSARPRRLSPCIRSCGLLGTLPTPFRRSRKKRDVCWLPRTNRNNSRGQCGQCTRCQAANRVNR